ncbi:RNA polymerase, sigma-24 subunit, ECF subfamily [Evansella cellulosilytica DSM 2522]|uniref:RNA polymerase sigma factor n=1 Tax=Evansella cellulosilytica (strain ATCC 21833 / DSM 2522 / FERM P-1141 / JCM 9156 / N-4) TaxID=649639 RepID=E6TU85_EVAC2|nr:RNA polymerase, sigma-24 subunit, ECF subfamily [Evansella cellulosilytica DSM 2522]
MISADRNVEITKWHEEYGVAISKYIYRMLRDYHQAEDLTQETFIKAFRYFESFEEKSNPKTWLYSIAHNVTIDYLRKRRPLPQIEDEIMNTIDTRLLPEEIVERNESVHILYNALENMKPSYREVIVTRRINECSIKETSEKLTWSEGKVKSTLHRAMPVLMKELQESGYSYEQSV